MKPPPAPPGAASTWRPALRDLLGSYPTGVAIVTTRAADGRNVGLTINSFASLSLDPPLVLWSLVNRSPNLAVFRDSAHFAINILASGHEALARRFADPAVPDKFADVTVRETPEGVAAIDGALATLVCAHDHCRTVGDHLLLVGQVVRVASQPSEPLVFHAGRFTSVPARAPAIPSSQPEIPSHERPGPPARTGPAHGAGRRPRGRPDPDPVALVPGAAAAAAIRPGAGLQDRTHLALRRGRPRLVLEQLLLWRAHRHALRRPGPLDQRPRPSRQQRRHHRARALHRAGRGAGRQRRGRAERRLAADRGIHPGLGTSPRPHPAARLGAAAQRLVAARAGSGRLPQPARGRRAHARPDAGSRAMADPRARRARLRSGDHQHRCRPVPCLAAALSLPHADAWRQPLRPAMPEEPGSAAAAGRHDPGRAAEDRGRLRQPLRVLALVEQA